MHRSNWNVVGSIPPVRTLFLLVCLAKRIEFCMERAIGARSDRFQDLFEQDNDCDDPFNF